MKPVGIKEFLEDRTDNRKHLMHFNSHISSFLPSTDKFFLDDVIVYDTVCRSYRRTDDFHSEDMHEENWIDILGFLEQAERSDADLYISEGFDSGIRKNLKEEGHGYVMPEEEALEKVIKFYDSTAQPIDLSSYTPINERSGHSVDMRDRKIISAAYNLDAAILTYDGGFLGYTDIAKTCTPKRALESLK